MLSGWRVGTFGDVVRPDVQKVDVARGGKYPIVGVLGFGRGLLFRDAVDSATTRYAQLNRVRPQQLVYSKLKAFEGAVTVAPGSLSEAYASSEFPTFTCTGAMLPDYLRLVTQRPVLWEALAAQSKGVGGRRERLHPSDLLDVAVAIPPLGTQRRIVDLLGAVDATIRAATQACSRVDAAIDTYRDIELWNAAEDVPLSELCSVDGKLVSPTGRNAALPHVGTDRIAAGTGALVGVVTAAQDAVTSGKYPFGPTHVIYSKIRPNLRKVALPDFAGLTSADAYPLLPTTGVPRRYLQQLLLSHPFTEQAVARSGRTKMPKINRTELMSIRVPKRTVTEMASFSVILDGLVAVSDAAAGELRGLRDLRSNLLTALLSGEHEIPDSYDDLLAG